MTAARREARDDAAAGHAIEHGVLFGHPQRPEMQRRQVAENDDLAVLGPLAERAGQQVRRRHQAIDILVMLVEHDAVEAKLVGVGELVEIFLIEADRLLAIEQAVGNGDPAALVFLVETLRRDMAMA